jgi:hypothetical protein
LLAVSSGIAVESAVTRLAQGAPWLCVPRSRNGLLLLY